MARDISDSLDQAKAIAISPKKTTLRNQIGGSDLQDVLSFRLRGRSSLKLRLGRLKQNADIELIQDTNKNNAVDLGDVVASSRSTENRADVIKIAGLAAGRYFARVIAKSEDTTAYRLALSASASSTISPTYEIVLRTNEFRQQNGLAPLALNTQLTRAAQRYARQMGTQDFFSHTGKDGSSPWDRIRAADYDFSEAAENLAAGHTTPASAMNGWFNSSGHRRNLLAYQVQEIGVGYFYQRSDGGTVTYQYYWAQSMATPGDVRVNDDSSDDEPLLPRDNH